MFFYYIVILFNFKLEYYFIRSVGNWFMGYMYKINEFYKFNVLLIFIVNNKIYKGGVSYKE